MRQLLRLFFIGVFISFLLLLCAWYPCLLKIYIVCFFYILRKIGYSDKSLTLIDQVTTYNRKQLLAGVSWKKLVWNFKNIVRNNLQYSKFFEKYQGRVHLKKVLAFKFWMISMKYDIYSCLHIYASSCSVSDATRGIPVKALTWEFNFQPYIFCFI